MKNVDTVTKVSAEIISGIQGGTKPCFLSDGVASVVGISGAAALGKTTFARELAVSLNNQGTTTALVELDGFLLERSRRRKLGLSGYSPDATDLEQLSDSLHQLVAQARAVDIPVYDHKHGGHKGRMRVIPREVIILDGIVSLGDHVRERFVTYGVFLNSSPRTMRGLRLRVDTGERGYSIFQALDHADHEIEHYNRWIEGQRSVANMEILVGEKWELRVAPRRRPQSQRLQWTAGAAR